MYGNNFYNPYMYANFMNNAALGRTIPSISKTGLGLSSLFKKFNFSGFLNGASKTLNVVNQAIPIYYQVKPMINNAKTMFKVMKAVKTPDHNSINANTYVRKDDSKNVNNIDNGNPTFFI